MILEIDELRGQMRLFKEWKISKAAKDLQLFFMFFANL